MAEYSKIIIYFVLQYIITATPISTHRLLIDRKRRTELHVNMSGNGNDNVNLYLNRYLFTIRIYGTSVILKLDI